MNTLLKSQTAQPLMFLMIDSSDHITGKTGLSPTVTLSKNGGSFASPSGAVTEVANGWYKVAGNATDTGTLGPLILHASASGADPVDLMFAVVAYDPQDAIHLGLSAVGWSTLTSSITTANSIGKRILDFVTTLVYAAPLTQANVRTALGMASANLDTQLAGLPSASIIATAVASAILLTPANKIATDGSNRVSVNQTGYALSTDALTAVAAAVEAAGGSIAGPGGDKVTVTILKTGSSIPITQASVWISTDAAGADVIAGTSVTDDNGHVSFLLTSGDSYYLWMRKAGDVPILGQLFTAVKDT